MYLRIIRGPAQSGKVDELAKLWEEIIPPQLREAPGFRHAYFVGNREQNTVVGVQVWDQLPDQAKVRQVMQTFLERAGDLVTGPPTIEDYEILVEV
jgi:quinol monooxygenase YgiN